MDLLAMLHVYAFGGLQPHFENHHRIATLPISRHSEMKFVKMTNIMYINRQQWILHSVPSIQHSATCFLLLVFFPLICSN